MWLTEQHKGNANMANVENKKAALNNSTRINVERSIKSHNDPKKRNGVAVFKTDFNMVVDFTTCTPAEIMAIAVDQIVIAKQSAARSAFFSKENMPDGKTPKKSFNVIVKENIPAVLNVKKEIVEKARTPGKSLLEKTASMFATLSPEEQKAQLARLQNMMKAGNK